MIIFDLDDLIMCLIFSTTHTKPAISSFDSQWFFLAKVSSLERKKISCTNIINSQRPFERALLKAVYKTIALNPNFLDVSRFIHRIFAGLWCTKVDS